MLGDVINYIVYATSIHGDGPYSEELSVVTSSMPDGPAEVSTEIDGLSVKILWVAPNDNYGLITSYVVEIAAEGTDHFTQEIVNCDGSDLLIVQ
jgi:hypothetical protein